MAGGPPGWAWQDDAQLHITLRFIGEVERPVAEDLAIALESARAPTVEVGLRGVGWFDQGRQGVLFARVVPRDPLESLHKKIDRVLVSAGLQPNGAPICPILPSPAGADPVRIRRLGSMRTLRWPPNPSPSAHSFSMKAASAAMAPIMSRSRSSP